MQYRLDKYGNSISILAYGCMRFTKKGSKIDLEKAEKEVLSAINLGVNYFDTAYIYSGSEEALGKILEKNHCREKINLATKLPQYLIKSKGGIEKYFNEQLSRLRTNYIDYYLMHMLTDVAAWKKLERLGMKKWIEEKKKAGIIRNIGFSFHGNTEHFLEILNAYDWDFCMIQYNYLDETSQAGRRGLEEAARKKIPVMIMEPLRGGKLVELLPKTAKDLMNHYTKQYTPAEWAFRWLWNQPEVTTVLSGMNSIEMIEENAKIASTVQPKAFETTDFSLLDQVKQEINRNIKVGCTGCGYCMPCPKGVDIPTVFRCYNQMFTEGKMEGRREYMQITALQKEMSDASKCIQCGACEQHCPQKISIRQELKNAATSLQPLPYRVGVKAVRLFKFW